MQITKVEPILFDAGLRRVWCFVRVDTDEGITGYGEATTTEPFMAATVVRRLAEWLAGEDPRRIQDLWQRMYRRYYNVRGGNLLLAAMSGIEHALWDVKGKIAGLPVYELLGGAMRDRVPVYANHMFFPSAADPSAPTVYAERAAEAVERGYRAVKIEPFGNARDTLSRAELRHVRAVVRAVRESVGPDVEIGIDSHARFGVAAAIQAARALEEFEPFFLEEPVPPENVAALRKVRESISVPIATGERLYTKWGFHDLLEAQAAEIIQVDVAHCGGILEARLIAAMAETHYVQVAPHSWYGPVSLAASLHLDACIPNFLIQETPVPHQEPEQQRELLLTPLRMEGGMMAIPSGPGLGITLNEEVLERFRIAG
ncbi:MAG: galactonate dehydratase [Chloroflexi bacterium]|nr:galactonate dehydratase [Chloroflexota bacterium]